MMTTLIRSCNNINNISYLQVPTLSLNQFYNEMRMISNSNVLVSNRVYVIKFSLQPTSSHTSAALLIQPDHPIIVQIIVSKNKLQIFKY